MKTTTFAALLIAATLLAGCGDQGTPKASPAPPAKPSETGPGTGPTKTEPGQAPPQGKIAPPTPAPSPAKVGAAPATSAACKKHMEDLFMVYMQAFPRLPKRFDRKKQGEMIASMIAAHSGRDALVCPVTKAPYIMDSTVLKNAGVEALAMDAKPHPDGTRYVLQRQSVDVATKYEVVPYAVAKQQSVALKAQFNSRNPDVKTVYGKCLKNEGLIARALIRYANATGGSVPPGKDLKKELGKYSTDTNASTWVCPDTKKPYTLSQFAGAVARNKFKGVNPASPVVMLYDSVPHRDGSRSMWLVPFIPQRYAEKEWKALLK